MLKDPLDPQFVTLSRRVHAATYSVISWKFRLLKLPENSSVFIEEMASDALQILPHFIIGFGKSTKLLMRSLLENCLRFIYFSDHPIEFRIMNTEHKWYLSNDKLIDFARMHPDLVEIDRKFKAIDKLVTLYDGLSAGVHGRRVVDLELRHSLQAISFDSKLATFDMDTLQRCVEVVNILLIAKCKDKYRKFDVDQRRIIIRTLPKSARGFWNESD